MKLRDSTGAWCDEPGQLKRSEAASDQRVVQIRGPASGERPLVRAPSERCPWCS